MRILTKGLWTTILGASLATGAQAADITVTSDISVSTTWTADNVYNLANQVYVHNGATLTIEPGTIIASEPTVNGSGSLAVARGSKIFVMGTRTKPVIMTSTLDRVTWTVNPDGTRNPKTGTWREGCSEWGNLTLMGKGFISEDKIGGNSMTCSASNVADMEGLLADPMFPGRNQYGGGDDDDCSGTVKFLSLRYGGRVLGFADELNGFSLGGIGRETDIHHIDIMNNVDDGIEIWGGTVNLKYVNIWNVGDDSFDIDQGWRGQAQFGLIVQGWSCDDSQGSGVGDNCIETDGAEDSDFQPVTTATLYNFTAIGQPAAGDHGTAWRDNARVQYRNCIWMDLGEELVKFDGDDGDCGSGYGHNGTLSWANTWTTSSAVTSPVNACASPGTTYQAQLPGMLAEIKDSVFFRNQHAAAYTQATARGVFNAANNNVLIPGIDPADGPIRRLERDAPVMKGGLTLVQVTDLDPRPANEALTSVATAPANGFFTPANWRGAFGPDGQPWICDWTASAAYGFTPCSNETPSDPRFSSAKPSKLP